MITSSQRASLTPVGPPDPVRLLRVDAGQATSPVELHRELQEEGAIRWHASSPGATALRIELPLASHEHVTGFGERFAQVDKRGHRIDGWVGVSDLGASAHGKGFDGGYKPSPVWFSSAGYAAVLNSDRRWTVDIGLAVPDRILVTVPGDSLELLLFAGPPRETLPRITARFGRAQLAAPWVFGVWRASRGGHNATIADADAIRSSGISCSAIWLDAHWQAGTNSGYPASGGYPLGEYPDIAETVRELHDRCFRVLTYVNPFLYPGTPAHDYAVAHGYAISAPDGSPSRFTAIHPTDGDVYGIAERAGIHSSHEVALVDFTNPAAKEWWQGLLAEILERQGFDGWMEDFGEEVPADALCFDGTTASEGHNRYPVLYHGASAEQVQRSKPEAATFARSAYLGSVPHSTVLWPGDQTRDWSRDHGIGAVPAAGITAGLMGAGAWGPDIGGVMDFADLGDARGGGSHDEELYLRWCQLGAMSPVMRDHLGFFAPDAIDGWSTLATVEAWRRWSKWHIRHFPYLHALALDAHERGLPILRGLMVEYPDDPRSWVSTDTFLWGDALLCAPVLESGVSSRQLELPDGEWWDTFSGERFSGGGSIEFPAPLDRLPVLQRSGTVVPLLADSTPSLVGDKFSTGDFDLELRVAGQAEQPWKLALADGTRLRWDAGRVTADGPERRYVLADHTGRALSEASGSTVEFAT